jgi:hypothetical protein
MWDFKLSEREVRFSEVIVVLAGVGFIVVGAMALSFWLNN